MIAEQELIKNKQENIPVDPETVESGKEKSLETEEDLEKYSDSIVAEAEKIIREMKNEGEQNLGHAEGSIGLSAEKCKEMEQKRGRKGSAGRNSKKRHRPAQ